MNLGIQSEVEARVRRTIPDGAGVLHGSLPVVSFGIRVPPPWRPLPQPELTGVPDPGGRWLPDSKRRLASLHSLGVEDPGELDAGQIRQVVAESYGYFRGGNWYRPWFG